MLLKGDPINIIMREGDIINVNAINSFTGISGCVQRPGFMSLPRRRQLLKI